MHPVHAAYNRVEIGLLFLHSVRSCSISVIQLSGRDFCGAADSSLGAGNAEAVGGHVNDSMTPSNISWSLALRIISDGTWNNEQLRNFIYDIAEVLCAGPGETSVVEFEEAEFVEVDPAV